MGYKRIGCILCPMSQLKQKVKEMKDYPHVKNNWIKAIKKIREITINRKNKKEKYSIKNESKTIKHNSQKLGALIKNPNKDAWLGSWQRKTLKGIWKGVFK